MADGLDDDIRDDATGRLDPFDPPGTEARRPVRLPYSAAALERPPLIPSTLHTTLVATDIEGFGAAFRDDDAQLHLREKMYALLADAFTMSGLPWWKCLHEDRGDGALVIAPPDAPTAAFLDPLAHHLTALLRRANGRANRVGHLRMRVAVHAGRIQSDAHGLVGRPLVHLFRLLEAPAFREAFTGSGADLGLVVSEEFYRDTTTANGLINRAAYRPLRVICKETRVKARVWFPVDPR
ncbi:hypothetical protein [Actinomadura kijaniata]|uniref:hypothetical protein n=1 Tax=Actinomadura kijaniata TaxID=46161 RepID=UPI00082AC2D9|nr:hypothetical protein [Actinomadura kijaniata]